MSAVLRGPADAEHYRVKVGRYGDRWYTDPLPGSRHWPQSEAVFPSISTVKKASGQDWSFVSLGRIAKAGADRLRQIADLDDGERYDALTSLNKRGLAAAAERGILVHLYAEAKLRGTALPMIDPASPAGAYRGAVDAFFDEHQPELVAAEYVVIHRDLNGTGYGGTPDAIVRIGGDLWAIDWKTRTETSDHGAYPEEGAQIAAGALGHYMIVEGDHGPTRQPIPQVAGGLVVSIKPDGCKVYPVDLGAAWSHWEALHSWWCARRAERSAIGRPWAPGKRRADTTPKRVAPQATTTVTTPPDEGATVADVSAVRDAYKALDAAAKSWVDVKRAEALAAGADFHLANHYTLRRVRIMTGLVALAAAGMDDDDMVRALVRSVSSDEAVMWPTAGAAVASLGAVEAAGFAAAADLAVAGRLGLSDDARGPLAVEVGGLDPRRRPGYRAAPQQAKARKHHD